MVKTPANPVSLLAQAIELSIRRGIPAFAFRMPGDDRFYWGACECDALTPLPEGVAPRESAGFLFAPFDPTQFPRFFFPVAPQPVETIDLEVLNQWPGQLLDEEAVIPDDISYEAYEKEVQMLVEAFSGGELKKAVLSRTVTLPRGEVPDNQLFVRLAEKYRSAFVSWVHLPGSGRWIGATPETLLRYDGRQVSTMALAGTRKAGTAAPWGEKEKEEQQIVTDYIVAAFHTLGFSPEVGERFTCVAGQVEHLCTPVSQRGNFGFDRLNGLLSALHPTPAVGGYPKSLAREWIGRVESHSRRYYGEYLGPVSPQEIALFVNLRCMEVTDSYMRLYVGGGLTAKSQPESEGKETEAKEQTVLSVINQKDKTK